MSGEFSPYLVATPLLTLMFAFYGRVMPFGALGYVGGALAGFVWLVVAGGGGFWVRYGANIRALSADAVLFACIIVAGSLVGGGVLYLLLFWSVLREPSTTYAALSALMRPTVPFFIALNSAMEVLFVPPVMAFSPAGGCNLRCSRCATQFPRSMLLVNIPRSEG